MSKYRIWYDQIMARARGRELDGYSEKHHVVPQALGGTDAESNIVRLTYREHFLAHWLIAKFTAGVQRKKMLRALHMMSRSREGRIICSWQYDVARTANRLAALGNKYALGNVLTEDRRRRISESLRGNKHTFGHKLSPEHKAKISAALKGKPQFKLMGRKLTAEHCAKLSAKKRGVLKTPSHRAALARHLRELARTGRNAVEQTIARNKSNPPMKGKKQSAEHKAKKLASFYRTLQQKRSALGEPNALS